MLLVSNIAHSDSGPAESEGHKLHLVRDIAPETPEGRLGNVSDLAELDANYAGISEILRLWFSNYRGPGKMSAKGFGDRAKALKILGAAVAAYPYHED